MCTPPRRAPSCVRWHTLAPHGHTTLRPSVTHFAPCAPCTPPRRHFVSINTETDWHGAEEETTGDGHLPWLKAGGFGAPGEYLRWLEADLSKADAARKAGIGPRWIIAGGHRPMSSGGGNVNATHGPLFRKFGVDAYFCGHSHSYTRSTWDLGIGASMLHVTVGGAGCDEMKQAEESPERGTGKPSFHTGRYASGVLSVAGGTATMAGALSWKLIDSVTADVLDTAELDAPHSSIDNRASSRLESRLGE
jgi:hypothetical protein